MEFGSNSKDLDFNITNVKNKLNYFGHDSEESYGAINRH